MKKLTALFSALVALIFSVSAQSQITPPYYNPANVNITGGNINGTTVGETTPANATASRLRIGASNDLYLTRYGAKQLMISGDGVGATTNAGIIAGYYGSSGYGAIWSTGVTPSSSNYVIVSNGASSSINGTTASALTVNNVNRIVASSTVSQIIGDVALDKTITTAGTTGNRTINKTTGRVNFAAAATSLTVTNSLVTANSIIHCTVATNDTTMKSAACVPGSGSFVIYANAAATAETAVAFTVTN